MWCVPAEKLCAQHLLGEHVEMHMFAGSIEKGISIEGYILNGLVNPRMIKDRHDELAEEMTKRGYHHKTPLDLDCSGFREVPVNGEDELRKRCPDCLKRLTE